MARHRYLHGHLRPAVFAVLPVLRNTMVGLDQVDKATIEAGRGMGMSKMMALGKIELPLAVPVILAGVRTALIINVGMATLAFLIGGGGLGETINAGLKFGRDLVTFTGASMVALYADHRLDRLGDREGPSPEGPLSPPQDRRPEASPARMSQIRHVRRDGLVHGPNDDCRMPVSPVLAGNMAVCGYRADHVHPRSSSARHRCDAGPG